MQRLGWAIGIEEQLEQPAIAVVVIDVAADAESFVASLLMTMRVDVVEDSVVEGSVVEDSVVEGSVVEDSVVEDSVVAVAVVAAAVATVAVEWRLAHPVTATLACPRECSNHHFDFLTSFVNYGVVPSGET
jgi:hypothetical protein